MLSNEKFTTTIQFNVDALLALSTKAFEGVEKLAALNMQVSKTGLAEAAEAVSAALSVKDPQSLVALQAGAIQPAAEKANAYGQQVAAIMAETKTEFEKLFAQTTADAQSAFSSSFEAASKNAPAGSENGMALWTSAVAAANNGYEALQKAAKQATDVAQANYTALTDSATKATQSSSKSRR